MLKRYTSAIANKREVNKTARDLRSKGFDLDRTDYSVVAHRPDGERVYRAVCMRPGVWACSYYGPGWSGAAD